MRPREPEMIKHDEMTQVQLLFRSGVRSVRVYSSSEGCDGCKHTERESRRRSIYRNRLPSFHDRMCHRVWKDMEKVMLDHTGCVRGRCGADVIMRSESNSKGQDALRGEYAVVKNATKFTMVSLSNQ